MPPHGLICPTCGTIGSPGDETNLTRSLRPWPVLPWRLLAWVLGVLGILTAIGTPVMTVVTLVAMLLEEGSHEYIAIAVGVMPFAMMGLGFALGVLVAVGGGIAVFAIVLVVVILRPARDFRVLPLRGPGPAVEPGWALKPLIWLDRKVRPYKSDEKIRRLGFMLVGLGLVLAVLGALVLARREPMVLLCVNGFGLFLWSLGWVAWLHLVLRGTGSLLNMAAPTDAERRLAALGDKPKWMEDATRGRRSVRGRVHQSLGPLLEVPDGGPDAIAWHVQGRADAHEIDDANATSFLLETDEGTHVAILVGPHMLVDLDPGEPSGVVLSEAFLKDRGLLQTTIRARTRRLEVGDPIVVWGEPTKHHDQIGGYRGGQIDALTAGQRPLVIRHADGGSSPA
jgi:hypothetical protein